METTPRDFLLTPSSPRVLGPDVRNDLSAIVQQDLAALRNAADVLSHFSPVCSPSFSLFLISGANLLDQLSSLPPLPLCACVRAWMWVLAQPGTDIIYNLMHNLSIHPSIHHSHSYFLPTCRCLLFSLFVNQSVIHSLFVYFSTSVYRTKYPTQMYLCSSLPPSLWTVVWCLRLVVWRRPTNKERCAMSSLELTTEAPARHSHLSLCTRPASHKQQQKQKQRQEED